MRDNDLREHICLLAKSMFDRGLTGGSTGNISARTENGDLLVSPTGTSFGRLDPARLSLINTKGVHVDGDKPTKEMPLHSAFYDTRSTAGAVIKLVMFSLQAYRIVVNPIPVKSTTTGC